MAGHDAFKRRGGSRGAARGADEKVIFPGDLAIGVREPVGTGGRDLSRNGITKAVMDVSGPQARGE